MVCNQIRPEMKDVSGHSSFMTRALQFYTWTLEFEVLIFRALTIPRSLLGPCKACCHTYLHNIITTKRLHAVAWRSKFLVSFLVSFSVLFWFYEVFISTGTRSLSFLLHTGQRQEWMWRQTERNVRTASELKLLVSSIALFRSVCKHR